MKIEKNIPIAQYTTFKIGGNASFFCVVKSVEDLKEAFLFSRTEKIPFFILGGGSNILVSDSGFKGLVIKMEMKGVSVEKDATVISWAGEGWDELVAKTVEWNLWGLENLSAIPGTVGASPVQNIGAYGVEVMSLIQSVTALDSQTGEEKIFSNKECKFTYRDSVFKRPEFKKYVITSVAFKLSSKPRPNIAYKDISLFFEAKGNKNPTQGEIRDAVIEIRSKKFPDLSTVGTAGSFWKNLIVTTDVFERLKSRFPEMASFPFEGKVKIPLAWVLDNVCKLKGYSQGRVGLFKSQPLVVVSEHGASSREITNLADLVKTKVRTEIGLEIEREVEWVE